MEAKGLYQIQKNFWKFIVAPEGVAKAIPHMQVEEPESVPISGWIRARDEDMAVQRLNVYAEMYFYRLFEVLQEDYEFVQKAIGPGHFHNLIVDYLLAHPSKSTSLYYLGRKMPQFLKEYTRTAIEPWIVDLAHLECALTATILMPNDPILTLEALQALPPESWADIRFQPIQALQVVESAYDLGTIWSALNDEKEITEPSLSPSFLVVWRRGFKTDFLLLAPEDAKAFQMLLDGASFGEVCSAFLPELGNEDDLTEEMLASSSERAFTALIDWLGREMLTSFTLSSDDVHTVPE